MSKALKPEQVAAIMLVAGFPANDRVIAEGLAVVEGESGFNPTVTSDGLHIGLWQEDSSFGSKKSREDPVQSTKAAHDRWTADGNSFTSAWGKWDNMAQNNYPKYLGTAKKVVQNFHSSGGGSSFLEIAGIGALASISPAGAVVSAATGAIGDIIGGGEAVVHGAEDTAKFVGDLVSTLLNFRKMGELLAKILAWFLRLIFRAIWDYCIAPIIHWEERAVSYYFNTFFSFSGSQGKSGFDRIYRENAGIVTIIFWALGYGILWTTPDSPLKLANSARQSILGRSLRSVEGRVSRRKLVKPKDVKEKTPPKPMPRESVVTVERTKEFSTARKRPVAVDTMKGREYDANQTEQGGATGVTESEIILPPGVSKPIPRPKPKTSDTSKKGGTGMDTQPTRSNVS